MTQALGSLGPSFSPQPDLLKLGLGKCEQKREETRAGIPFPRKAEEVGKLGSGEESGLVFPNLSVPPCPFGEDSRLGRF